MCTYTCMSNNNNKRKLVENIGGSINGKLEKYGIFFQVVKLQRHLYMFSTSSFLHNGNYTVHHGVTCTTFIVTSTTSNFEILGAPIGSSEFCGEYIEAKRKQACSLLHLLPQLCYPQVSILLLHHCASFCKLSHLGCSIPPCDSSLRQFMLFDEDVLHCLEECPAFEYTLSATKLQVQLPLRHGGLGLTSV